MGTNTFLGKQQNIHYTSKMMKLLSSISIISGIILVLTVCLCNSMTIDTPKTSLSKDKNLKSSSSQSTHYKITNKVMVYNSNANIEKLITLLPVPVCNEYQTVKNLTISDGTICNIADSDNSYIFLTVNNTPQKSNSYVLSETFEIRLYPIRFDFEKITEIYPYDKQSTEYKRFLGKRGEYVDPTNPHIVKIGNQIWDSSSNILDYAKKCYEYVASNYQYLNPNTGIHPLADILKNGGGDCGNLTSIYVSLLRYKNIPSRHIITIRPNGTYHVWSDFLLEKYGWIPVDVTEKLNNPKGDYFGYCAGDGIVMSKDLYFPIDLEENKIEYWSMMQTFLYWYWGTGSESSVSATHVIEQH